MAIEDTAQSRSPFPSFKVTSDDVLGPVDRIPKAVAVPAQGCQQFLEGCAKRKEFRLSPQSSAAAGIAGAQNEYNPMLVSMVSRFQTCGQKIFHNNGL